MQCSFTNKMPEDLAPEGSRRDRTKRGQNQSSSSNSPSTNQGGNTGKGIPTWVIWIGVILIGGGITWGVWTFFFEEKKHPPAIEHYLREGCDKERSPSGNAPTFPQSSGFPSEMIQRELINEHHTTVKEFMEKKNVSKAESRSSRVLGFPSFRGYQAAKLGVVRPDLYKVQLPERGELYLFFGRFSFGCGGQHTTVHTAEVYIPERGRREDFKTPRTKFRDVGFETSSDYSPDSPEREKDRYILEKGTTVYFERTSPLKNRYWFNPGGEVYESDIYTPPTMIFIPRKRTFPWVFFIITLLIVGGVIGGGGYRFWKNRQNNQSQTEGEGTTEGETSEEEST